MSNSQLNVEIVTPDKTFTYENVKSFFAPGNKGYFEVLKDHAPYMVQLEIGKMEINDQNGSHVFAVSGGLCEVKNNTIRVITNAAEDVDSIDLERAEAARQRAEKRLSEKNAEIDVDRARIALLRALNRITIVEKYKK
ncbi:MAG: F0F1 ATP synthase subunit epsilon [Calditrichia bacterium]